MIYFFLQRKQMFVNFFVATNLKKCGSNLELIFHKLEMGANIAIHWLNNNEMVANSRMFQLTFLARNKNIDWETSFLVKTIRSSNTAEFEMLYKNKNFKRHIENICSKALDIF